MAQTIKIGFNLIIPLIAVLISLPPPAMGEAHSHKADVSFYSGATLLHIISHKNWAIKDANIGFQLSGNYRVYRTLSLGMNLHYLFPGDDEFYFLTLHLKWDFYNDSYTSFYTYLGWGFYLLGGDVFGILKGPQVGVGFRIYSLYFENLFLSLEYNFIMFIFEEGTISYFPGTEQKVELNWIFHQFTIGIGYAF